MVSVLRGGAYAEQMVAGEEEAVFVPSGLDLVDVGALPMGVMTGYDLIEEGLDVQSGETVIITGAAGSVGRAATYAAPNAALMWWHLSERHPKHRFPERQGRSL